MPDDSFYPTIEVVRIDDNGNRLMLFGEDVEFFNITQNITIDTLTADGSGIIEYGGFDSTVDDAAPGDVVELRHATYTRIAQFTLQTTQDLAFTAIDRVSAYVAEDDYSGHEIPEKATIFITDDAQPDQKPLKGSEAFVGGPIVKIPAANWYGKNLTIRIVPVAQSAERSFDKVQAPSQQLAIPGNTVRPLFDHASDVATVGNTEETLRSYTVPAGTLGVDHDKITTEHHIVVALSPNDKQLRLEFAGTTIANTGTFTDSDVVVEIETTIIREANGAARCASQILIGNDPALLYYTAVSSLDLAANAYDIDLLATTPDAAGDLELKMAHGLFIPAAPAAETPVLNDDEDQVFNDDNDPVYVE